MPFKYQSGEEVQVGDRVIYGRDSGKVEFIVTEISGDPAMDWYLKEYPGGGFMILTDKGVRVFLQHPEDDEDLDLVSRSPK